MAPPSRVLSGSCAPYETDARASRKRETDWVGYKVHLTETCGEEDAVHLIVQAEISAATEQDVEETMPLLRDAQARDLEPEGRLVDSGYVSGEVLATHAELGIELVGPLKQEGGWQHKTGYGMSAILRGLGEATGALSPRAPLAELVSGTTQSRRGGDPGERICGQLSGLSSQRAVYEEGEGEGENFNPFASIGRRGTLVSPNATRHLCLSAALCSAGRHRRHDF